MFNKLFLIIKKVIIAILMIYTYNIIVFPLGITIAFNVFTIILIGIFWFTSSSWIMLVFNFNFLRGELC